MTRTISPLRLFAGLELLSLAVLLVNLATGDSRPVAAAVGPIHGCLYLCVIVAVARNPLAGRRTTAISVLPAVGGVLALRRLDRAAGG